MPSQLSSTPSQVTSVAAAVPGLQLSTGAPAMQAVDPVRAQAPVPQVVTTLT